MANRMRQPSVVIDISRDPFPQTQFSSRSRKIDTSDLETLHLLLTETRLNACISASSPLSSVPPCASVTVESPPFDAYTEKAVQASKKFAHETLRTWKVLVE